MYLQGNVINDELRIIQGLRTVYGLGAYTAKVVCDRCHIPYSAKVKELDTQQQRRLQAYISTLQVGHLLQKEKKADIFDLINNKTYRGYKHLLGLPVKGQRTKTNAKTRIKHLGTEVTIAGREYFKSFNKEKYINNINSIITPTSHAHYKTLKKKNQKKKGR